VSGGRRLALHTWTLDRTPLDEVLDVARRTGWDAVELRRVDFLRAEAAGRGAEQVIQAVAASGLEVACVGVEHGWMWATGAERDRLLAVFAEQCRRAAAAGATRVMSPVDKGRGDLRQAAASVREVGDVAAEHGVSVAVEFNSQAEHLRVLERLREVLARAGHPRCGLLLDTYHLGRSGATLGAVDDVRPEEIVHVQYSDPPREGLVQGETTDRLPPGRGSFPFKDFFALLAGKGYAGHLSYEAPNPAAWARPAEEVAREALEATRAVL
jgi:4-hydroxyphenylpyruvate dioxygenase